MNRTQAQLEALAAARAKRKIAAERQQVTELNQQLHVLEQTLKG